MRRALTALLFTLLPSLGFAQADEEAFRERVRAYLLDNPEVILEALAVLTERDRRSVMQARIAEHPALFTDPPWLGIGAPAAPLRVVEFFDYKCAPCKAVHPVLVAFAEAHPQVRIEMRQLPILSPGSERAARFALAAQQIYGEAAYADVHDMLWQVRGPLNSAAFQRIAKALELDHQALAEAAESDAISARISDNRDVAIALEILGTPAFVTPTNVTFGTTDIDLLSEAWLSQ